MKMKSLFNVSCIILHSSFCLSALAQGTAFTYQGRLNSAGNPANGFFDITFGAWTAASGPVQVGPMLTNTAVAVSNGLFTVTLDFGAGIFTGADRWLEISVRTNGGGGFTTLTPRQKLTATPYAINSGTLAGTLPAGQLSGTVLDANLPANLARLNVSQSYTANNAFMANVGIGTAASASRLEIADTQARARLSSSGLFGSVLDLRNVNEDPSVLGTVDFTHTSGLQGQIAYSWNGMDFLTANQPRMRIDSAGRVGIGTTAPAWPLDVQAGQGVGRFVSTNNTFGSVLELRNNTASPTYLGAINFQNTAGTYPGQIGYLATDALTFRAAGAERMRLASNGQCDVYGSVRITGNSSHSNPFLQIKETEDGDYARIQLQVANRPLWHISVGGANNSLVFFNSTNSIVTSISENGLLTTKVLTITGGADIAEPFQMSQADLPKGAVVVIDEDNPGHLKLSEEAYDQRVAGIISGAGGVQPGLSLSQQGVMEGGQHVALSGRVYVQADTTNGPIKPGDLLTTSSLPGHAMRATERERTPGAVIGKAMTALSQGKGLVLVLVSLQ